MAVSAIKVYAHLSDSDVEQLADELDAIRRDVEASLGEHDARYIARVIVAQRVLELAGRVTLLAGRRRWAWLAGAGLLALAKIVENMELGHNISHGQWDWMNDPEIHSTTWEWDMSGPSSQWKRAHNYNHHTYTNIVGMDEDLGFSFLRMTRDQPWRPVHLLQPLSYLLLASLFDLGIALHDWKIVREEAGAERLDRSSTANREFAAKLLRQVGKDFVLFPALSGRGFRRTLAANATAHLIRNVWSNVVIFCGHFPDGAEKFAPDQLVEEKRGEWYLRQLLGSANFDAGPVMAFLSGHLSHQIEHHLFPDLPSNRYAQIAARVRAVCERYDLPYTTSHLAKQYWLTFRTINKLALPDALLRRTSDDAPETGSERRFVGISQPPWSGPSRWLAVDPATGRRRGLRSALQESRRRAQRRPVG